MVVVFFPGLIIAAFPCGGDALWSRFALLVRLEAVDSFSYVLRP